MDISLGNEQNRLGKEQYSKARLFPQEDCFFDIHCVLVTQVNDQKTQQQLTAGVFFSYKSAVVNYH